ncbi:MAG TPA: LytTR family DNA-binding domain-containing protein [Clostridiales bacterium]|nr:LytTR family DNA-binding domain-containing protein [Clostridiales bacterium]
MRIAICDDNPVQAGNLQKIVSGWIDQRGLRACVSKYPSAEAFLFEYAENMSVDILLLDILLSGMNGVELARRVRESDAHPQIVFISAYSDFVADGYDVDALHYLMKPIEPEKLCEVLDKAVKSLSKAEPSVMLETEEGIVRLLEKDIIYAEAFSHIVCVKCICGDLTVKTPISELETQLGESFVRCHRSYLVGLRHIRQITRTDVILDDGGKLPLSRRNYDAVNRKFISFYRVK